MPKRINNEIRRIIIRLHALDIRLTDIQKRLEKVNIFMTPNSICKLIKRWETRSNTVNEKPRCGRPATIPAEMKMSVNKFINLSMKLNNELTCYQLQVMIERTIGLHLTCKEVRWVRKKLGWRYGSVKYAQTVRDVNKVKRVNFCQQAIENDWQFRNAVFTDECTVQLEQNRKKAFFKNGDKTMLIKSRAKHPVKLHVWAGISMQGATRIVIFDGTVRMDSRIFCEIIEDYYVPFNEQAYGGQGVLVQDNDPKHKSRYTTAKFEEFGVRTLEWPPESPDINDGTT